MTPFEHQILSMMERLDQIEVFRVNYDPYRSATSISIEGVKHGKRYNIGGDFSYGLLVHSYINNIDELEKVLRKIKVDFVPALDLSKVFTNSLEL